ncbi:unnamed protein product [Pleuronectes platessa]|uniref:Uncharacterized protein n=1 Tax=Pleuronectes platessa TaxID=8262 RepID=A0A9N7V342_PLEPL|nr:unnamed protein product [Pleuronectes platessa]
MKPVGRSSPVTDAGRDHAAAIAATETSGGQSVAPARLLSQREKCKSKAENSIRPSQSCIRILQCQTALRSFFTLHKEQKWVAMEGEEGGRGGDERRGRQKGGQTVKGSQDEMRNMERG